MGTISFPPSRDPCEGEVAGGCVFSLSAFPLQRSSVFAFLVDGVLRKLQRRERQASM